MCGDPACDGPVVMAAASGFGPASSVFDRRPSGHFRRDARANNQVRERARGAECDNNEETVKDEGFKRDLWCQYYFVCKSLSYRRKVLGLQSLFRLILGLMTPSQGK